MRKRTQAVVGLILVMSIWGSSFAITKASLAQIPPLTFALLRFLVASSVLSALCYPRRKQLLPLLRAHWRTLFLMGLSGITFYYVGYQFGLVYGTATQGSFIQALIPAATVLAALFFLHEPLSRQRACGIGVSFLGVIFVIFATPSSAAAQNPLLGAAFMMSTVVAWTFYTIFAKRLARADALLVTMLSTVIGTVFLCPFVFVEIQINPVPPLTIGHWLSILYLGAVSSAGCYLLYNWSLAHLDAGQAANYLNLLPIVGVVVAVLFLGEVVVPIQILGGACVLLGVWLATQLRTNQAAQTA